MWSIEFQELNLAHQYHCRKNKKAPLDSSSGAFYFVSFYREGTMTRFFSVLRMTVMSFVAS